MLLRRSARVASGGAVNAAAFVTVALMPILLAAGALLGRSQPARDAAADVLNAIVVRLCLPAAVLLNVPGLKLEWHLIAVAGVPWCLLLATVIAVRALCRLLPVLAPARPVLLLLVPLGNTSFLGYPLVETLLGREALPYAVIYDQFGSFLIVSTYGLWILARAGGASPSWLGLFRRILTFPPFPALLLALILPGPLPSWMHPALGMLSACILPLALIAVGLRLGLRLPAGDRLALIVGLLLKLLGLPVLAWGLGCAFGLGGAALAATVLESAMPPMITAAALAAEARLRPELAAAMVAYGLLASLFTLPLWAALLR